MGFRHSFSTAGALLACAISANAATLAVDVRDTQGNPLADAVVYAMPQGKELGPVNRTAVLDQKNKTFVPHVLPVQVGTSVKFPNSDDIQHQVYSFSPAKTFKLPLYKGTPANPIVFTSAGVVTLGCNIHDKMSAFVVVLDTPYFQKTEADGRVRVEDLPPGKYDVHVWHPDSREEPSPRAITVAEDDRVELSFSLASAPAALSSTPVNKLEEKFKKYGNVRP